MTYDKNYSGSAGTSGSTTGTTGGTGSSYGRSGSLGGGYGSSQYGSSNYGSQGSYGSPYSSGYENWSGSWAPPAGGSGKMLVGLLVGAAAGAAIALLLAPTSGREARQGLSRWAKETGNKANEMASNLRQRFNQQAESFGASATQNPGMNEDRNIPEL
jgi:hypothetical protein